MSEDLFEIVHRTLQGEQHRPEWFDCDCPFCGKEAKRGQVHFSYSHTGYKCWVCGASGGLRALADRLNVGGDMPYTPPVRREPPAPRAIAPWRQNPERRLAEYQQHPDRYRMWASHKPLKPETIDRFGFGFGRLPFERRETGEWYEGAFPRLIVPIYQGSSLAALRGRAVVAGDEGAKWIGATGSVMAPWGLYNVTAGSVVWICENYVDAAWLMQSMPGDFAIGLGGVSSWKEEYGWHLSRLKPEKVIVALDNDLPGQARGDMRRMLEDEWRSDPKHRGTQPPASNGARLEQELRGMGMKTLLFEWPACAPAKAGIDWMLSARDVQ